jgi:hypothetical protein
MQQDFVEQATLLQKYIRPEVRVFHITVQINVCSDTDNNTVTIPGMPIGD